MASMDPNAHDRVRPVPIEPEGDDTFGWPQAEEARPERASRPWLPLAIAVSAIVIVFVSIGAFGAIQFEDPEEDDPAGFETALQDEDGEGVTTTTLPPSLEEMIPEVKDRLTLITRDANGVWAVTWDPAFRVPKQEPIEVLDGSVDGELRASFDRSGQYVAFSGSQSGESLTVVGQPTSLSLDNLLGGSMITWHASEVGRLAYMVVDEQGTSTIYVGSVDPATGSLDGATSVLSIEGRAELTRFDRHGFILRNDFTQAFDPDGVPMWAVEGVWPASANDSTIFVVDQTQQWLQIDRLTGAPIEDQRLSGSLDDAAFWVSTTEDTDLIARIVGDPNEGKFSMTVVGGGMRAPRIKAFDEQLHPLRFTRNGDFFVFTNRSRTELVFVDWWNGAEYTVPMPDGHTFFDFHLG